MILHKLIFIVWLFIAVQCYGLHHGFSICYTSEESAIDNPFINTIKKVRNMQVKLFGIAIAVCIAACGGCSKSPAKHPKDTIRIDVGSEVPTLDPTLAEDTSSTRVMYDLFAGLVDFDQHNTVIPGMAERWEIAADGKTYTFHLRTGLRFSDGSPITAEDFVYTFRRLVDPQVASPYSMLISNIVNASAIMDGKARPDSLGVAAPDANTFVVKLVNVDSSFLKEITLPNVMVVPKNSIEKFHNKWTDPANMVTSGAYMLKEHVVNGYITAEKNPHFWNAADVHIPKIKYLPYEDKNATIPAYRSGGLDVTMQNVPIDQFSRLKQEYPEQLHVFLQEAVYYYDFSWNNPELAKNPKLRQALSMAIDREVLTKKVLRMGQMPLYSTVTATVEDGKFKDIGYDWASWPRDKQIAEAKKLYAEAGYGPNNPYHASFTYNSNDLHKKTALAITAMWKAVLGIDYQIARDGWVADYNTVTTYTNLYQCNNQQNNSHYCNPAFDKLVAEANVEKDTSKQTALYKQALQIPLNDYAVIPLFQYTIQVLVKPYISGYDPDVNHLYHTQTKWMSLK